MHSRRTTISCRCIARITTGRALLILAFLALATASAAQTPAAAPPPAPAQTAAARLPDTVEWSVGIAAAAIGAPVMAGSTIVVPLSTGVIAAYALRDGAPAWSAELRAEQSLGADADRVYVAAGEAIHALAVADGRVAWRVATGGPPTAPPLVQGGWVIAAAAGDLIAIRATDGTVMWRQHVGPVEFRPSIDGELLVASIVDGQIAALDVRDGSSRWTVKLGASPTEPVAIGGRVYVGTKDRYFYWIVSSSGRIEHHKRVAAELLGRVAVTDDHVYYASLDNTVNAMRRRGGSMSWHQGVIYRPGAGPVVVGDAVIVPGYVDMPLPAFAAATGAPAGNLPFGGLLVALPLFITLPDGRDGVVGAIGGLENKWMLTLRAPSLVPPIAVQPLTVLPGIAVPIVPPPGG